MSKTYQNFELVRNGAKLENTTTQDTTERNDTFKGHRVVLTVRSYSFILKYHSL